MANPIALKGLSKLMARVYDSVTPRKKDLEALPPGGRFEASGTLELTGHYGFDKSGELALAGRVSAALPESAPIDLELNPGLGSEFESLGSGTLHLTVSWRVEATSPVEE